MSKNVRASCCAARVCVSVSGRGGVDEAVLVWGRQ